MAFCLLKKDADRFTEALKSGEIDPAKLVGMTSAERHSFFEGIVGKENARDVNALLEAKLLLKNQQQGMITWAKTVAGMKPAVRRDLISRIEKMENVLDAKTEDAFLSDLAEKKLGVGVSHEEAAKIVELSQNIKKLEDDKGSDDTDARMEYGRAVIDLQDYVDDLKQSARKTTIQDFRDRPLETIGKGIKGTPGLMKSVAASMDASAIFRQGWKTMWSHPKIWAQNALKSLEVGVKTVGGKNMMREVNADIHSRKNYDLMKQAKLDVGAREEAFPTSLPERIPIVGRAFKGSEAAYTAFTHKVRADVFDKMIDIAKKSDVDLTKPELEAIGKLVNSLTGRGHLGKGEGAAHTLNVLAFSPKNLAGHIQAFTQPFTGAGGSDFVRKQAAQNLLRTVAGTAGILAMANFLRPGSVEWDPRSSDFGKIKIGNTRFDVSGGSSSLITLAARLVNGKSKSSTTGKMTDLYAGKFGSPNALDVIESFLENKASPVARVPMDFLKGKDFDGNKMSVKDTNSWRRVGTNAITPLPIQNFIELVNDPEAAKDPLFVATATALDALGVGTNTYGSKKNASSQR